MDSTRFELPTDELLIGLLAIVGTAVGWFFALRDLARRDDLSTGSRVVWVVVVIALGLVGVVLYFLFRPRGATPDERAAREQASDEFVRRHSQQPPADDSPAT